MGNLLPSLPATSACAIMARSKSLLDFNTKAGLPEPSTSSLLYFSTTTGPPEPGISETANSNFTGGPVRLGKRGRHDDKRLVPMPE